MLQQFMHGGGPYLWLPTGVWHAKICSCSRIDILLRNKGTMLPFTGRESAPDVCSQFFEVDNGNVSSRASTPAQ